MDLKSIRWRLPFSYAAIALLAALALGSVMLLVLDRYYTSQERQYLQSNALSLQPVVEEALLSNAGPDSLQTLVASLSFFSQTRIRLLDTHGNPLADSGVPGSNQVVSISSGTTDGSIFSVQPETVMTVEGTAASQNQIDVQVDQTGVTGPSTTLADGSTILIINASPYGYGFVSMPVADNDTGHRSSQVVSLDLFASLGTLEISKGPAYGRDILRSVSLAWAGAGLLAICLAALAGWFASRQVTLPVLALGHATRRMESGDLSTRVSLPERHPAAEFQALAHSFNSMAQRMDDTVSTLRSFVADAAHELHTPLTALHTNLELAADETTADRRTQYLQRAQEQSARLEGLVRGLLDLSRIEAGQLPSETGPLVLNRLLGEMEEQLASRAEQANRVFALELPGEPILVSGNAAQLRRAITNLFDNSLKFTPAGGSIKIELSQSVEEAILTVTDTGIGVPPEDLPHLFERFHRGRNASSYPGSGLGLAITRALIAENGGCIQAEPGLGHGAKMTIKLPLVLQQ